MEIIDIIGKQANELLKNKISDMVNAIKGAGI